jgi:hypothetical protein
VDSDPGWKVSDRSIFTPIMDLDTGSVSKTDFVATSIRPAGQGTLGSSRRLIWAVAPVSGTGGKNTAFQEFQVIAPER